MADLAYAFRRMRSAVYFGHVGWGFQLGDSAYYYGATEGRFDLPEIFPGHNNGWWAQEVASEADILEDMRARGYDAYKRISVETADPASAKHVADSLQHAGYHLVGNDCVDHVKRVLEAFGVACLPDRTLRHVSANEWFARLEGSEEPL
jgi:hypothetical protein